WHDWRGGMTGGYMGRAIPAHRIACMAPLRSLASTAHARHGQRRNGRGGRPGVAAFDGRADPGAGVGSRDVLVLLHAQGFLGKDVILDLLSEPARVVVVTQMVHPGGVIDAVR